MARYFIDSVEIEGFRGIYNSGDPLKLEFAITQPTSVHAVNGRGKSSVYEALYFAFTGSIPRLAMLQVQEGRDGYINNLFHASPSSTIQIRLIEEGASTPIDLLIVADASGHRVVSSPSGHAQPAELLDEVAHNFVFLDHNDVRSFVEATPTDRARELSRLLGLQAYSDTRKRLSAVVNGTAFRTDMGLISLTTRLAAAEKQVETIHVQLSGQLLALHPTRMLANASNDFEIAETWVLESLAEIDLIRDAVQASALSALNFDELSLRVQGTQVSAIQQKVANKSVTASALAAKVLGVKVVVDTVDIVIEKGLAFDAVRSNTQSLHERELLRAAGALALDGRWLDATVCPICGTHCTFSVIDAVESRLAAFGVFDQALSDALQAWKASPARTLEQGEISDSNFAEFSSARDDVSSALSAGGGLGPLLEKLKSKLQDCLDGLVQASKGANMELAVLESQLPAGANDVSVIVERARATQSVISKLQMSRKALDDVASELATLQLWKENLSWAAELWAEAEEAQMSAVIADLDQLSKSYFQRIMNNTAVVPVVARSGEKVALDLADFHGRPGAKAKAVLSESYRNAYVLSVFLAAAKSGLGGARFIVLDDVTSSFDGGHQSALAELLRTEIQYDGANDGLQVILFSHDSYLEKYLQTQQDKGLWRNHRLLGRSPDGVLRSELSGPASFRAQILKYLDDGSPEQAKPIMRQYLESQLSLVIRKMRIPVPYDYAHRDDRKMVSISLTAITDYVSLLAAAGRQAMTPAQQSEMSTVHAVSFAANWISHFETGSADDIDESMLRSLLDSVDDFVSCFKEPDLQNGRLKWRSSV